MNDTLQRFTVALDPGTIKQNTIRYSNSPVHLPRDYKFLLHPSRWGCHCIYDQAASIDRVQERLRIMEIFLTSREIGNNINSSIRQYVCCLLGLGCLKRAYMKWNVKGLLHYGKHTFQVMVRVIKEQLSQNLKEPSQNWSIHSSNRMTKYLVNMCYFENALWLSINSI